MLHRRSAGARVRSRRQPGRPLGRSGCGLEWPNANHGITIDYKDNVWIGGNDPKDAQILKFTRDGKFLLQVGRPGKNAGSHDTENFWRAAKVVGRPGGQRSLRRRRLRQQARGRDRRRHRQVQALLGRLRRQAR